MQPTISAISPRIVLPDVSLAAIVRDEMMNPAGGIVDFVHSTVPFVEEAVIVDAGSKDGTRQKLEELQAEYPQLRVFDRQFDDYASSRNHSLAQVRTKYALVLDADERIRAKDFAEIALLLKEHPAEGYNFRLLSRYFQEKDDAIESGHNPRLFLKEKKHYKNYILNTNELLYTNYGKEVRDLFSVLTCDNIVINHFRTTMENMAQKSEKWYLEIVREGRATQISPSDLPESQSWKAYNPRREDFR